MNRLDQRGVTTLELLIGASLVTLLAIAMGDFVIENLRRYVKNEAQIAVQQNTRVASELLLRTIRSAQAVESSNRWPDPNGPGGSGNQYSWSSSTSNPATLVLAVPAVDTDGNALYADSLHNSLHTNDVVFYIDASSQSLYRRVIANPVSGNAAKTTCPPALATASCPPDTRVIDSVANLTTAYLLANNVSATTPSSAAAIQVTLTQQITRAGVTNSETITAKATMRN